MKKRNSSSIWNGISSIWEHFYIVVGRKICNGKSTKFWWHYRPLLILPLSIMLIKITMCLISLPLWLILSLAMVTGIFMNGLNSFLPLQVIQKITIIETPSDNHDDRFTWRKSSNENFSVKSTYLFLQNLRSLPTYPF